MRGYWGLLLSVLGGFTGCATVPGVTTQNLPLKRVVIYRNGVAYFERQGSVSSERLSFQVRPDHIGDFLATLSVMEAGGSSVRAASFPLALEDKEPPTGPASKSRLSTVTLELDGKHHDLAVGYVAEQPVWKPSYRLIFEKGEPTLQAWGIIQNISGEDWRNVSLSLIAGAPIAFRSTLGTPVTPGRPVVTDTGEVIAVVPRSETTISQEPLSPPPSMPSAAPAPRAAPEAKAPSADEFDEAGTPGKRERGKKTPISRDFADGKASGDDGDKAAINRGYQQGSMAPRDYALLASRTVQMGTTRYDIPHVLTVPNDSATMVMLLDQRVPGESVFLFAPEGGVPDSSRHPFRVARFKNVTDGLLERGPLAVFEEGAFLGQGVLEALSAQGEAIVPFAVERAIALEQEQRSETLEARLAKIEHGQLTIERDQVHRTLYRIKNGASKPSKVVVRHPRQPGAHLYQPPAGTEDQMGKGNALIPSMIAARSTSELKVEERRAFSMHADWFSPEADAAVKAYRQDARAEAKIVAALKRAWDVRESIVKANNEVQKLRVEKGILERSAHDTREGLNAIGRHRSGVSELRAKLSARLLELDEKLADLNKRLVEFEVSQSEQRVAFTETVRDITLKEPLPAA
jgi:hypothetical protein